ncbi:hypothetical protein [Streptomyces sp. NPDC001340]
MQSAWGVQYTLSLPSEDAARAAAAELSGMGHRLTAVRVHDHFRFRPSSFWYGRPSMDPELDGTSGGKARINQVGGNQTIFRARS